MSKQKPSSKPEAAEAAANTPHPQAADDAGQSIDAEASGSGKAAPTFPLAIYAPTRQYRRFAALAATIALAAALGGLVGSLSTLGLAAPKAEPADDSARKMQAALTQVSKDIAALKTSLEASNRTASSQISKLNERFERSERAQAEPAAKIAALTDSLARIDKKLAVALPPASVAASADARDVTGSIPAAAAKDQSKPMIVEGWVLRDIYRGRALVESRSGLYEIVPGADLPGLGRVETITRQNGRWVVVTPKGLIVSMR